MNSLTVTRVLNFQRALDENNGDAVILTSNIEIRSWNLILNTVKSEIGFEQSELRHSPLPFVHPDLSSCIAALLSHSEWFRPTVRSQRAVQMGKRHWEKM